MSAITDRIQVYKNSGAGWEELKKWLALQNYPTPERHQQARDVTDDLVPYTEGSWDEVRRCRNQGLLTQDEYMQVVKMADTHRGFATALKKRV